MATVCAGPKMFAGVDMTDLTPRQRLLVAIVAKVGEIDVDDLIGIASRLQTLYGDPIRAAGAVERGEVSFAKES